MGFTDIYMPMCFSTIQWTPVLYCRWQRSITYLTYIHIILNRSFILCMSKISVGMSLISTGASIAHRNTAEKCFVSLRFIWNVKHQCAVMSQRALEIIIIFLYCIKKNDTCIYTGNDATTMFCLSENFVFWSLNNSQYIQMFKV